MTMKQYEEVKEQFFTDQKFLDVKNKYNWEHNIKEKSSYRMEYMSYQYERSEDLQGLSLDKIKEEIDDFESDISEIITGPLLEVELDGDAVGDYDSSHVEGIYLEATYYVPMKEQLFNGTAKTLFRDFIGEKLKPKTKEKPLVNFVKTVDCKTLQMFEEEELTWKGLQKIVYGNCDL